MLGAIRALWFTLDVLVTQAPHAWKVEGETGAQVSERIEVFWDGVSKTL